jgi:putative ABC transport system ATP-binding protein
MPGGVVHAVRGVTVRVGLGQLVALRGRSGSGKTTLLSMIGALDRPTRGSVSVGGMVVSEMAESELVDFRRRHVGFIFQAFGLMPILSAAENVEVPLRLVGAEPRERDRRVQELLDLVGLGGRARHRPHELSGGEQQRVAIARALANRPPLLLADEPTGQLDTHTGRSIMKLLQHVMLTEGMTVMVATHDPMLIDLADRVIELRDGEVVDDRRQVAGSTGDSN